jgi:hypothetical protein
VNNSARFVVEYQQINLRARLDAPALADPNVRDLLQESDLFVGSFAGMGGFGLLSPLECIRGLATITELLAHIYILLSLTTSLAHVGILLLALASSFLPFVDIFSWIGLSRRDQYSFYTAAEARHSEKQLKMRNLAYGDVYRSEVLVFGLSSWIVDTWASARRATLGVADEQSLEYSEMITSFCERINTVEIISLLQNVSHAASNRLSRVLTNTSSFHYSYSSNRRRRPSAQWLCTGTPFMRSFSRPGAWRTPHVRAFHRSS